jgi:hypothetical protein
MRIAYSDPEAEEEDLSRGQQDIEGLPHQRMDVTDDDLGHAPRILELRRAIEAP